MDEDIFIVLLYYNQKKINIYNIFKNFSSIRKKSNYLVGKKIQGYNQFTGEETQIPQKT